MKNHEYEINPMGIEHKSMDIIEGLIGSESWDPLFKSVIHRIVHTSGDPDYANIVEIHPEAISSGIEALKKGALIITDVNMLKTGINKPALNKTGSEVICIVSDKEVADEAKRTGETRSMTAMKMLKDKMNGSIIAIGNAPTALFTVLELCKNEGIKPALIIGTPVGFVGAAESKDLLIEEAPVPYITVKGTKGGSPIAASVINALLYSIVERD